MNYADIKRYDVANGPGVRVSVAVLTDVPVVLTKKLGTLTLENLLHRKQLII